MEFDYPKGDSNEMTTYDGKAGMFNFANRLLFALKKQ